MGSCVYNGWVKKERYLFSCKTLIRKYQQTNFTVQKDLGVRLSLPRQVISNSDYGVYEGEIRICDNKINKELYIAPFTIAIALFCAVGLSIICLLYIVFHSLRHAT